VRSFFSFLFRTFFAVSAFFLVSFSGSFLNFFLIVISGRSLSGFFVLFFALVFPFPEDRGLFSPEQLEMDMSVQFYHAIPHHPRFC